MVHGLDMVIELDVHTQIMRWRRKSITYFDLALATCVHGKQRTVKSDGQDLYARLC